MSAVSGKTFETSDPYTGEPWALIPECDKADVEIAVEAAARAFDTGFIIVPCHQEFILPVNSETRCRSPLQWKI